MTRKWELTRTQADFLIEVLGHHGGRMAKDLRDDLEVLFGYKNRDPVEEFNEAKLKELIEAMFKRPFRQPEICEPNNKFTLHWKQ